MVRLGMEEFEVIAAKGPGAYFAIGTASHPCRKDAARMGHPLFGCVYGKSRATARATAEDGSVRPTVRRREDQNQQQGQELGETTGASAAAAAFTGLDIEL